MKYKTTHITLPLKLYNLTQNHTLKHSLKVIILDEIKNIIISC